MANYIQIIKAQLQKLGKAELTAKEEGICKMVSIVEVLKREDQGLTQQNKIRSETQKQGEKLVKEAHMDITLKQAETAEEKK